MKTIRWGIIGVGDVTEVKSGPGFQKAENSDLVAVMRRNGDLAKDYAERHNVPRWYDDAEALIHDDEVDAICIATPPHVHKEYTLMAAAAGKPVYCEKPMALTHNECQQMVGACVSAGVPLWVAYYRRRLDKFVKIKELLDNGTIGNVHMVTVQLHRPLLDATPDNLPWRVLPEVSGGGIFVDMGSHMLDILDYFFGPVISVDGRATNLAGLYPAEDNVSATFTLATGAIGAGSWCSTTPSHLDETVLYGSKGKITYSCFLDEPFILQVGDDVQEVAAPFPAHVQQPLIQSIVDELNGNGACPSTGESGARTTWVIDQILEGYRTKD